MVEMVRQKARTWKVGERVGVLKTLQRLTIDELSLSSTNCPMDDADYRALEKYANVFVGAGVALRPDFLFRMPAYKAARRHVENFLMDAIEAHQAEGPGPDRPHDLVDVVLAAGNPDGSPLSDADRVACSHLPFANGLIYGGRVSAYLLYGLLQDPELYARVTDEVDAAFAGGPPTIDTLRRMGLLRGALMESYRMYPIAAAVPRYVAREFEFGGYTVKEGTTVFVSIITPNFLPEIFPDPYRFDPHRYRRPRSEHRVPGAFAPYGLGSHVCISVGLIETVALLTVAALLRTIRMQLYPPDYTLKSDLDPVPGPEPGFRFQVAGQRPDDLPGDAGLLLSREETSLDLMGIEIDDTDLQAFLSQGEHRTYGPGVTIIRQGDPADAFFILTKGKAEVFREQPGQEPRFLSTLSKGDYFGEIGLLHDVFRTATVRAARDGHGVEAIAIGKEPFADIVARFDLTSSEIARLAQRRLISTQIAAALPALTPEQADQLISSFTIEAFGPGDTIIREGDPADKFYILTKGRLHVFNRSSMGTEIPLGSLHSGDFFGEIGILENRPRTATVRVDGDGPAEVISLERGIFLELMDQSEAAKTTVSEAVMERLLNRIERLKGA
jgi:CRP-like cAMP-binding protein/cytochrome P450